MLSLWGIPPHAPSLTILFGPGEDLLTSDAVAGAGKGQHLDTIVGVLLQAIQLQGRLRRGDVFNLTQLWRTREQDAVTGWGCTGLSVQPWASPSSCYTLKSLQGAVHGLIPTNCPRTQGSQRRSGKQSDSLHVKC